MTGFILKEKIILLFLRIIAIFTKHFHLFGKNNGENDQKLDTKSFPKADVFKVRWEEPQNLSLSSNLYLMYSQEK